MEFDSTEIQKVLPHRYPFLMVDRITECEPGISATGIKCVSANEMHFMGHFPEHPVMPGVLVIEAIAQVAAFALLCQEGNKGKIAFFGGIKNARFKNQVQPGDVLEISVKINETVGAIGLASGEAKVGGKLAAKADVSFSFADNKID